MNAFYIVIFFSIVLEMLPISSSSHVYLIKQYLGVSHEALMIFWLEDVACLINVVVIGIFFFKRWMRYLIFLPQSWAMIKKVIMFGFIVELITVLLYCILIKHIDTHLQQILLPIGLAVTTLALFSLRECSLQKNKKASLDMGDAIMLGCAQAVALLPGISRLACTYAVARWRGFSAEKSFELSWLIIAPLYSGVGIKGLYAVYVHCYQQLLLLNFWLTMLVAGFCAYVCLLCVYYNVQKNTVWLFGFYTLLVTIATTYRLKYT